MAVKKWSRQWQNKDTTSFYPLEQSPPGAQRIASCLFAIVPSSVMSIPRSDLTHGGVAISSMQASALDQLIVSFGGTPPALLADKATSALSLKAGHLRSHLDDGTVTSATLTHSALNAAIVAAGGTATGTSPVKTTKVSQLLDLRSSLAYVAPPPDGGGVGEGGGSVGGSASLYFKHDEVTMVGEVATIHKSNPTLMVPPSNYLLLFVGADRSFMYGLYGKNFCRGLVFGPATRMVFGRQQLESLGRWLYTLTTGGGCFFSMALSSPTTPLPEKGLALLPPDSNLLAPRPISGEEFHLYSDAAVEDTSGGLGGWVHGECWHFPLSQADRDLLHITAWEFVALGINIIISGRRLSGFQVHLLADALATVQVMFHRAAHSPHMQCIHRLILALPELACLGPLRSENHVFWEVNICADAASRGRFDLLRLLGRQFGLDVRRLPLPARAFEFLRQVRQAIHASNESEGATHSSDPAPRPQGRVELELMQHRGAPFTEAEDQPLQFPLRRATSPPIFALAFSPKRARAPSPSAMGPPAGSAIAPPPPGTCRPDGDRPVSPPAMSSPLLHRSSPLGGPQTLTTAASPYVSMLGPLPPVPSSHVLVSDLLSNPSLAAETPQLEMLLRDTSEQALRPADPSTLQAYVGTVGHAMLHNRAVSTSRKDAGSWRWWCQFIREVGGDSNPLRDDDPRFSTRERVLKAMFVVFLRGHLRSTIPGRRTVKPQTLRDHLHKCGSCT